MMIWELRCASVNDYAMIVPLRQGDLSDGRFRVNGSPITWKDRPLVGFSDSSRIKNKHPPADVSAMVPGALVLNERALDALGPFLSKFGQLLELESESDSDIRYFYNVTHLVPCVDTDRSDKNELGRIRLEAFDTSKVPVEASVFKDPATARSRIYVNDAGKVLIEQLAASSKLSGIECGPPEPGL